MSYDISLKDPVTKETIEFEDPHYMRGGMYAIGGTREAWLNITYNYADWYYKDGVFPSFEDENYYHGRSGIRSIYGLSGAESIPILQNAISVLENMKEDLKPGELKRYQDKGVSDYWIPTRKNAIKPLYQLLAMAKMRPDAVWDGD